MLTTLTSYITAWLLHLVTTNTGHSTTWNLYTLLLATLLTSLILGRVAFLLVHRSCKSRHRQARDRTVLELRAAQSDVHAHSSFFVQCSRGKHLHRQVFYPLDRACVGVVVFLHGLGSDATGSLGAHTEMLTRSGLLVYAQDYEGHGRSEGIHAFFEVEHLLQDVHELVMELHEDPELDGLPVFLFGISLGGHLACRYALQWPDTIQGMVVLCPAVCLHPDNVPPLPVVILARLLRAVFPELAIGPPSSNKGWTDLDECREFHEAHPGSYGGRMRVGSGLSMERSLKLLGESLEDIRVPLLVIHGTEDRTISYEGSELLFERAQSRDKTLILYEGCNHVLVHEPDGRSDQIVLDAVNWLWARCRGECPIGERYLHHLRQTIPARHRVGRIVRKGRRGRANLFA